MEDGMIKFLVLFLLVACNARPEPKVERDYNFAHGVSRFVDEENNVVCYTVNGEGISCVRKQ
jgi:uncharacterized protein YcfL